MWGKRNHDFPFALSKSFIIWLIQKYCGPFLSPPLQPLKIADKQTSGKHFVGLSQPVMCFFYSVKLKVTAHCLNVHRKSKRMYVCFIVVHAYRNGDQVQNYILTGGMGEEMSEHLSRICNHELSDPYQSRKWIINKGGEYRRSNWQRNSVLCIKRNCFSIN